MRTFFSGILASFIFLLTVSLTAGENDGTAASPSSGKINWVSIEDAFEMNKENPKKIFVDVFTDWCGWCKKMDASTFSDPAVIEYMNKHYYSVKLDAEFAGIITLGNNTYKNPNPGGRRSTHELAITLLKGKMSYPSYVFMDEKNEMLTVVKGYIKTESFQPIIRYFGDDAYLKNTWEEYQKQSK